MALTLAKVDGSEDVWGKHRRVVYDVTLDSSYPAGGEAITAAEVGLRVIEGARFIGFNAAASLMLLAWDPTNGKVIVNYPTGGATAAPAALADPISTTGASTASAVDATQPNITPGRGKEVLATTDLSTLVTRMEFIGD